MIDTTGKRYIQAALIDRSNFVTSWKTVISVRYCKDVSVSISVIVWKSLAVLPQKLYAGHQVKSQPAFVCCQFHVLARRFEYCVNAVCINRYSCPLISHNKYNEVWSLIEFGRKLINASSENKSVVIKAPQCVLQAFHQFCEVVDIALERKRRLDAGRRNFEGFLSAHTNQAVR